MSTQIVEFDLHAAPRAIRVRDDVRSVLVFVTSDGRAIDLFRIAKPASGELAANAVLDRTERHPLPDPSRNADSGSGRHSEVSVVVPTHERADDLTRCLESLAGLTERGHEVIVVDNDPKTSRTRALVERFPFRYVLEPVRGLNRARNAGVAAATRDIVAFIDDDAVASSYWLAALTECFTAAAIGCATGLVLPLELETPGQEEFEVYSQHRRELRHAVYSRDVLRPSAASRVGVGANMAFRRQLLHALGGFDTRLGPPGYTRAGDETDMFARILDAGHSIAYSPDAYVWHRHRRSLREMRSCVFGYSVGTFSVLTKRLVEQGDFGAVVTAGRWFIGPLLKALQARLTGRPTPRWDVVLADTAGATVGPFCFGYESWRSRRQSGAAAGL